MFTLARRTITTLVIYFGLSAWFGVKEGKASSSVRRTTPTSSSPRFRGTNVPASRRRRSIGGSRSRTF